ncbi:hypothetical protein, partial [Kitasatospora sp. NPDC093558]|uniref:hypothetical protein n=1 Tax=Kitasatospora sp. NPDC093558 TaxID=3155201 RepID=UPI00341D07FC
MPLFDLAELAAEQGQPQVRVRRVSTVASESAVAALAVEEAGVVRTDGAEPESAAAVAGLVELPQGAEPVGGVPGYHYLRTGQETAVFGPDNRLVAQGEYDHRTRSTAGVVGGVRIASGGYGNWNFQKLAAAQHRAAHQPTELRDRVWLELVPDRSATVGYVVAVRGTVKDDTRDEQATKAGNFYWSGEKQARVS